MAEDGHRKLLNTTASSSSARNRIRFAGTKKRALSATADVYRSYKRRSGNDREERVHNNHHRTGDDDDETTFAMELDIAFDRNASEVFTKLHREIWGYVRSLPEILHHANKIVDIVLENLLSRNEKKPATDEEAKILPKYVVNHGTADILHLMAVLARDLRHEIHPFLHSKIMPRLIEVLEASDVNIAEATFRTMGYIFRYDAENLLTEIKEDPSSSKRQPCLECLLPYYGKTLGHRRDYVRRLAAETFAPLIRKLPEPSKRKHLKRVVRALTTATLNAPVVHDNKVLNSAVDGIAWLWFEVTKGVKGRLHSKGTTVIHFLLECFHDSKLVSAGTAFMEMATIFFERLLHHLQDTVIMMKVWNIVSQALQDAAAATNETEHNSYTANLLRILHLFLSHRNAKRFLVGNNEIDKSLLDLFRILLKRDRLLSLDQDCRQSLLALICLVWKNSASNPRFVVPMTKWLSPLFSEDIGKEHLVVNLIQNLVPQLSPDISSIGPAILSAAADQKLLQPDEALEWIHALITVRDPVEESDKVFFMERAEYCILIDNVQLEKLMDLCIVNGVDFVGKIYKEICTRVRVASFLAYLEIDDDGATATADIEKMRSLRCKRVLKWFGEILERMNLLDFSRKPDHRIAMACTLEAMSDLAKAAIRQCKGSSWFISSLKRAGNIAESFLLANSSSLVALKSVASFVKVAELVELRWGEDNINNIFDALIPNLRNQSHFLRLHSLEIMSFFPKRPFVIDHADLDIGDDLDDEHVTGPPSIISTRNQPSNGPTGTCSILETLLFIEKTCPSLLTERELISALSSIGVLGRTGRLPQAYAEAAANHLLGLLNIKFSSLWKPSISALASLAVGHENCVWPCLHEQIASVTRLQLFAKTDENHHANLPALWVAEEFYSLYSRWEISGGVDAFLFAGDVAHSADQGKVSWHSCTDNASLFECLWNVVEGAPKLLIAHSQSLVSTFINFMHFQYFAGQCKDPDARELCLESQLIDPAEYQPSQNDCNRDAIATEKRLLCILKAFSVANGPQQFVKNKLLLSIFITLLSHRDNELSSTAFRCVLKFKLPYLSSHSDALKMVYEKGKFRDALMHVKSSMESDELPLEHRISFINILARILFGRLSARSAGSKSSKDSPSSRRNTVLSFFSSLCVDDIELFHFIYLALRAYVPSCCSLSELDLKNPACISQVLSSLCNISIEHCAELPFQVHQGFLNLMESVASQLGRKVARFVPAFLSIIFCISKLYEIKIIAEGDSQDGVSEGAERHGTIRSLCYRRIADILLLVADEPDIDISLYSAPLWDSLHGSLRFLPEMASSSDKVPSLLHLVRILSSERNLLPFLKEKCSIVPVVLQCLSENSKIAVVDEVLVFIENLMNHDDNYYQNLLQPHIGLMLNQFKVRFTSANMMQGDWRLRTSKNETTNVQTWRRELNILYRVCEMMELCSDSKAADTGVFDNLTSLLIPFIGQGSCFSDADRLNILEVLKLVATRIHDEKLVRNHYDALSSLLAPSKTKAGQLSKETRKSIACVLDSLAEKYQPAKLVTLTLLKLCSISSIRVDELDYDEVIPALSSLASPSDPFCWSNLCKFQNEFHPSVLSPLIQTCFYLLFDADGVVIRGSFKALKSIISYASDQLKNCSDAMQEREGNEAWKKILEGCIVPLTRSGIVSTREVATRKFFVLLMRDIAICNQSSQSPNLYGDLASLAREDEPDLDFFLSITHVQIHRRVRALRRLRTTLLCDDNAKTLSAQSLSNFLLPLALHPIYETKKNIEDSYALEGIATVGTICSRLSWKKYSGTLWTQLTQFERHPDQEKYLVGLICAIVDGFHFQTTDESEDVILRSIENRFFPKLESLLIKEKKDKTGRKVKRLRSTVVLALYKLIHKLPRALFESRFPRLLAIICDALSDRDSDAREIARTVLAKIASEIDMNYLSKILHELSTSLTEGYKLHVRTAAVHTILLELSLVYKPPQSWNGPPNTPPFDRNVPILVELLQQDLFGEAQERKDADGSKIRSVKEASGSKSTHALELIACMVFFRSSQNLERSGVQSLVYPFLERLHSPMTSAHEAKRIKECLSRIATGLLKNQSMKPNDVIAFVKTILLPFSSEQERDSIIACTDNDTDDDDAIDSSKPIRINGGPNISNFEKRPTQMSHVIEWRPSMLHASKSLGEAYIVKRKEEVAISKVMDGMNAPKLTGSARSLSTKQLTHTKNDANNSSAITVVAFGLHLLASTLKKSDRSLIDFVLLDSIVPSLSSCFCYCRDTEVVLLSLKCLQWLFATGKTSSLKQCCNALATKTLDIVVEAGANQELLQVAFKMLTALISFDRIDQVPGGQQERKLIIDRGECAQVEYESIPLSSDQMQVLISFLQESVVNSDHHQSAMALIKAITAKHFISAELYDLMEKLLEVSVRSPKASLRDQCGNIFVSYLINYPISEERIEQHLKQIVLNLNYEFSEGRVSAVRLLKVVIEKLPVVLVNKHCQLFFMPLTLRLANENSDSCRTMVTKCLGKLIELVSTDVIQSLFEYSERWSLQDKTLRRVSLQLFGLFVEERHDFIKRGDNVKKLFAIVERMMEENADDWEVQYFALLLLEKMSDKFGDMLSESVSIWQKVVSSMTKSHPWIRLVSCRLLCAYLTNLDPMDFVSNKNMSFLVQWPRSLHQISRNLCFQLGTEKEEPSDQVVTLVAKSLTWLILAMKKHPELCFESEDENDLRDPVKWVFTRLSNIARPKVAARRIAVFKCFAAFAQFCEETAFNYLELMLEPLCRSETETKNETGSDVLGAANISEPVSEESKVAKDVLSILEERCVPQEKFFRVLSEVKARAREKKEQRKMEEKNQFITDPENAAKRRIHRNLQEKNRRKRRIEEHRSGRGASAKRRST